MTKVKMTATQRREGGRLLNGAHGERGASGMLVIFLHLSPTYLSVHMIISP